jgi:hypothetical protein
MFDQRKAIDGWRAELAETGALFEADLDELESHLHDHLEALEEVGITGEEAFTTATERLGESRSLSDEFAKVNPLLAWRAALLWITVGIFTVLALRPVHMLSEHAIIAASMALHLGKTMITIGTWMVSFASPLVFFAVFFPLMRRRVDAPLPWARSPVFRVGLLVGCAVLMLASHLLAEWGWLTSFEQRWAGPLLRSAYHSSESASYALAVAAPLVLGGIAVHQRALALKDRATAAPLFWLAVGIFVGAVRSEVHFFVRPAAVVLGNLAKLQSGQMALLMWIVTLGSPLLLFASTYVYLRHRAPRPARVLRTPYVVAAMAGSGALAIAAVFATSPVQGYAWELLEDGSGVSGFYAWLLAGIVTSCALPVIVGTIMLRLLRAGTLVRGTPTAQ